MFVFVHLSTKYVNRATDISRPPKGWYEGFPRVYQQQHRTLPVEFMIKPRSNTSRMSKAVLTIQFQKRIIDFAFILLDPSKQFSLNIGRTPSGMLLVHFSCTLYQRVNPILGIGIFDTSHGLMTLNSLGDAQTGHLHLVLNSRKNLSSRTRITRLWVSIE